jgi:hypothetical protein
MQEHVYEYMIKDWGTIKAVRYRGSNHEIEF